MPDPPAAAVPAEVWLRLCRTRAVRPEVVAAARARLHAGERPSALAVADAVLRGVPAR